MQQERRAIVVLGNQFVYALGMPKPLDLLTAGNSIQQERLLICMQPVVLRIIEDVETLSFINSRCGLRWLKYAHVRVIVINRCSIIVPPRLCI